MLTFLAPTKGEFVATATAFPPAPTSPINLVHKAEAKKGLSASGFDPAEFVLEPKYDGQRVLVHVADDGVHVFSHTGTVHDGKLPKIEAEFARLPAGTWIDGEAVAFSVDGDFVVHDWGSVQSCLGANQTKAVLLESTITFVAFDLIAHANIDARSLPFRKRRELLEGIFALREWERVILTPQTPPSDEALAQLLAQGFEGAVVKSLGSRYQSGGRGAGQYKLKPQETEDFVVIGYKPGDHGWKGLVGSIIFGGYRDGKIVEVGRCSGMDMKTRLQVTKDPDKYLGTVIEVAHMGHMKDGYRHPQWKRWRTDKDPAECLV
jgi:bifunctional non-homologous end joining protein LigD